MKRFAVRLTAAETAEKLKEAVAACSMALVAHIDGQANCAKRGLKVPPDQILEVFRPDFALRVWQADKAAGIDIPLRIHIYEQQGRTFVAHRLPREVFARYGNPALDAVAAELEPIFARILSALDSYRQTP